MHANEWDTISRVGSGVARQTGTVWGFLRFFGAYFITATLALILGRSKKVWPLLAIDFDRPPRAPAARVLHVFLVSKIHYRNEI